LVSFELLYGVLTSPDDRLKRFFRSIHILVANGLNVGFSITSLAIIGFSEQPLGRL
jgi:hypothetical protein